MSEDSPQPTEFEGHGYRFGIVAARFNQGLVDDLLERCLRTLDAAGVREEDIETVRVPGSHEIPYAAAMMAKGWEFDAVIALGVVIAGDTHHHDMIASATSTALLRVGLDWEIPVINGIITTNNRTQAEERCAGELNRGKEFALAALEMAELKRRLIQRLDDLEAAQREVDILPFDEPDDFADDEEEPWKF